MPMFEIETYKVSAELKRFTDETRFIRVLEMTGPVLHHGIQNRATFACNTAFDGVWSSPVAGYLTDGFDGLSVVGWFPVSEFSYYYDIVRSERNALRNSGVTSGYLRMVGLGTSTEELGEGPSESAEEIESVLAARLTPARSRFVPLPTSKDLSLKGK